MDETFGKTHPEHHILSQPSLPLLCISPLNTQAGRHHSHPESPNTTMKLRSPAPLPSPPTVSSSCRMSACLGAFASAGPSPNMLPAGVCRHILLALGLCSEREDHHPNSHPFPCGVLVRRYCTCMGLCLFYPRSRGRMSGSPLPCHWG